MISPTDGSEGVAWKPGSENVMVGDGVKRHVTDVSADYRVVFMTWLLLGVFGLDLDSLCVFTVCEDTFEPSCLESDAETANATEEVDELGRHVVEKPRKVRAGDGQVEQGKSPTFTASCEPKVHMSPLACMADILSEALCP